MEIKRLNSQAIQQKASIENTEVKPSEATVKSSLHTGIGNIKDSFDSESKLFSDNEIHSARGSRDIYQTVDAEATYELSLKDPETDEDSNNIIGPYEIMTPLIEDQEDD